MKLTFTFTDEHHLKGLSKYDIYQTHFEFPNEALQLPDCEARLLSISAIVGQLTQATLHVNCKEIDWKQRPVKVGELPKTYNDKIRRSYFVAAIVLSRLFFGRSSLTKVIPAPNSPANPIPATKRAYAY